MKILIFGGSGFIGQYLCNLWIEEGHEVIVVGRNYSNVNIQAGFVHWDNTKELQILPEFKNVDITMNLVGESIGNHRWSQKVKEEILNSRVNTTKSIVNAINEDIIHTKLFINASAVGYYGTSEELTFTEDSRAGRDFLANVCSAWERELVLLQQGKTRYSIFRIGMVLGHGGVLNRLKKQFNYHLGGPVGSGSQWVSWIHIKDIYNIIQFVYKDETLEGPLNISSPNPIRMNELTKELGKILNKPANFKMPAWILKFVFGEMAELVLLGQKVIPQKLQHKNFSFEFPTIENALVDLTQST